MSLLLLFVLLINMCSEHGNEHTVISICLILPFKVMVWTCFYRLLLPFFFSKGAQKILVCNLKMTYLQSDSNHKALCQNISCDLFFFLRNLHWTIISTVTLSLYILELQWKTFYTISSSHLGVLGDPPLFCSPTFAFIRLLILNHLK